MCIELVSTKEYYLNTVMSRKRLLTACRMVSENAIYQLREESLKQCQKSIKVKILRITFGL